MRLLLSARGEMVSWTRTAVASGVTADAMGPDPNGYIAYHADGRLALVVGREGRKSRSPPTTVEAALFDTMLAYAASYEFEDGKVIHHVDAAWRPEWGPHLIRPFKLEGDRLVISGAPGKDPVSGEEVVYAMEFRRVGALPAGGAEACFRALRPRPGA